MSVKSDPTGIRRQRLQKMHAMLKDAGDVGLPRFLAGCSYGMGLTHETAMKYLRDLEELGLIEIDEEANVVREVVKE